jgi:hypothetical protein
MEKYLLEFTFFISENYFGMIISKGNSIIGVLIDCLYNQIQLSEKYLKSDHYLIVLGAPAWPGTSIVALVRYLY